MLASCETSSDGAGAVARPPCHARTSIVGGRDCLNCRAATPAGGATMQVRRGRRALPHVA